MTEDKLEKIRELREAYRKMYNKYAKEFNGLNERFLEQSRDVDELLAFMEKITKKEGEKKDDEWRHKHTKNIERTKNKKIK